MKPWRPCVVCRQTIRMTSRAIMQLAGSDLPAPVVLSPEEREAIARSRAAAGRGELATDEQVHWPLPGATIRLARVRRSRIFDRRLTSFQRTKPKAEVSYS
jgi:hypothetical protein